MSDLGCKNLEKGHVDKLVDDLADGSTVQYLAGCVDDALGDLREHHPATSARSAWYDEWLRCT